MKWHFSQKIAQKDKEVKAAKDEVATAQRRRGGLASGKSGIEVCVCGGYYVLVLPRPPDVFSCRFAFFRGGRRADGLVGCRRPRSRARPKSSCKKG